MGWHDRKISRLPVRNLKRMWDELGKFAYERFVQVNASPLKVTKLQKHIQRFPIVFVDTDERMLVVNRSGLLR